MASSFRDSSTLIREIEDAIDSDIADAVQALLRRLQLERARILALVHQSLSTNSDNNSPVHYARTPQFTQLMALCSNLDMGLVTIGDHHEKAGSQSRSSSAKSDEPKSVILNRVADILQSILARLQAENDRLLRENEQEFASNFVLRFEQNGEFNDILERLLQIPIGSLKKTVQIEEPISIEESPLEGTGEEVMTIDEQPNLVSEALEEGEIAEEPEGPFYENMQVIHVENSSVVKKPSDIIVVPSKNCFALLWVDHLSISSAFGQVISTYRLHMTMEEGQSKPLVGIQRVVIHPSNGHLYFHKKTRIYMTERSVHDLPLQSCSLHVKPVPIDLPGVAYGLAIFEQANVIYTVARNEIFAFSLSDWSRKNFTVREPSTCILAFRESDKTLFYSSNMGHFLHTVPVESDGTLRTRESKVIEERFERISALAFDSDGNILVADKPRGIVKVLSPDGHNVISSIGPPDLQDPVLCTSVAVLDMAPSSRIIAATLPPLGVVYWGKSHS